MIKGNQTANHHDYQLKIGRYRFSEVQIAILTYRINDLNEHLKEHKKDHHPEEVCWGRWWWVRRRKLSHVLKDNDLERYRTLIARLGLRK